MEVVIKMAEITPPNAPPIVAADEWETALVGTASVGTVLVDNVDRGLAGATPYDFPSNRYWT